MKQLLALLLLIGVAFANVYLVSPLKIDVTEITSTNSIEHVNTLADTYLGKIAQGQKLDLTFSRSADENFKWNSAEILGSDITGTVETNENYIIVHMQVPANEGKGLKQLKMKFINNLNLRTPELITFNFDVSEDLYKFTVPADLKVYAGKPTNVQFTLESNSISTDELILGDFEGLPAQWSRSGTIQILPNENKTLDFTINALDEGFYDLKFKLSSTSGAVLGDQKVSLRVLPTLRSKFRIYGEGFAFIPAILQPFYSLASWFGI